MNNPARNKDKSHTQSDATSNAGEVSGKNSTLTEMVSAGQHPEYLKHLARLRAERAAGQSERVLAERYEVSPTYMHYLLTGAKPVGSKLSAKIEAANPGADFTFEPPAPVEALQCDVMAAQRGQAADIDLWVTWAKSERGLLLEDAADAIAATTPELQLHGSAAYRELVEALGDAASAIPTPVQDGPIADLQTCLTRLEGLVAEATACRESAVREFRADDALKLGFFVTSTRGKLKRLSRQVTASELLEGEAWLAAMVALCDALRYQDDDRSRIADALDVGNELCRDAARRLRLTRHIVFPCASFRGDPVGFGRTVLGHDYWPGQIEILEALRDHRRISIRSCNKAGKTQALADFCLYEFATNPNAHVILGNKTIEQLGGQLWDYIQRGYRESGICLDCRKAGVTSAPCAHSQCLRSDGSKMHVSCHGESGGLRAPDGRKIYGRVSDSVGGLLGFSGAMLVVILDEASELSHDELTAWDFNCSAKNATLALSGNPLKLNTAFYETHFGEVSTYYQKVHLSGEDACQYADKFPGLISHEQIQMAAAADPVRGRDSDDFRCRVLGEFPLFDVELSLTDDDIAEAHIRCEGLGHGGPLTISVDPGGEKDRADPFGFCARRGSRIVELYEKRCSITESIFVELDKILGDWINPAIDFPVPIRFDGSARLGVEFEKELCRYIRQAPDQLRAQKIMPGQNSFKPGFKMWRDWSLDNLVLQIIKGAGLPHSPELDNQLRLLRSSQKLEDDKSIRVYIPKSQMRTRLHGASPNLLDAVAYCFENIEQDAARSGAGREAQQARDLQRARQRGQYSHRSW